MLSGGRREGGKRVGYGAGLPITRQGWVLILSFIAVIIELAVLAGRVQGAALAGVVALILLLTVLFLVIARARTDGDWRWRSGGAIEPVTAGQRALGATLPMLAGRLVPRVSALFLLGVSRAAR